MERKSECFICHNNRPVFIKYGQDVYVYNT